MRGRRHGAAQRPAQGLTRLAVRNASRYPLRSLLTTGLIASAVFVVIQFDGRGHESGTTTTNFSGGVAEPFTGTYHVNADCTGSATDTSVSGQTTHVNFVLVEHGNEWKVIAMDPGNVLTGTGDRMASGENSGEDNSGQN